MSIPWFDTAQAVLYDLCLLGSDELRRVAVLKQRNVALIDATLTQRIDHVFEASRPFSAGP